MIMLKLLRYKGRDDELRQAEEEHEKVKFLPEHFEWKPLNLGKYDPDYTEYANNNSHIFGNRNTIVHNLTTEEEHRTKVERYEAYLLYGKYYREIIDAIANFDGYQSDTSGGGGYLIEEVLEKVPQISKKQLMYFWYDVPKVIEKRTQEVIDQERQRSLDIIKAEAME